MKIISKQFDTQKAKGKVTVTKEQADMLNFEAGTPKFTAGEILIIQKQYPHKEDIMLNINGKNTIVESAQLYVTVVGLDGTTREETIAVSALNKFSFGKEYTQDIRAKQTPKGIRGEISVKNNLHITNGDNVRFKADKDNAKYFVNDVALKVGDKFVFTYPELEKNDAGLYDYKSSNGYLITNKTETRVFEAVEIPAVEVSAIPADYAL